jgi:hypothetical protein
LSHLCDELNTRCERERGSGREVVVGALDAKPVSNNNPIVSKLTVAQLSSVSTTKTVRLPPPPQTSSSYQLAKPTPKLESLRVHARCSHPLYINVK